MANNESIEVLFRERNKLVTERDAMNEKFNTLISGIETSIEILSGKKVWESEPTIVYDDENHDYIKQSIEEI